MSGWWGGGGIISGGMTVCGGGCDIVLLRRVPRAGGSASRGAGRARSRATVGGLEEKDDSGDSRRLCHACESVRVPHGPLVAVIWAIAS